MADARGMRRWIAGMVIVAVAARVLRRLGVLPLSRYVVEGSSMEPAYHTGDHVIVNRWAYRARAPRAGDVVVVRDPERDGHVLLKRIARSPDGVSGAGADVYVLGDNVVESRDSRSFGTLSRDDVIGRAWFRY